MKSIRKVKSVIGEIIPDDKKLKKTTNKHSKHNKAINIVEEEDYSEGDTDMKVMPKKMKTLYNRVTRLQTFCVN